MDEQALAPTLTLPERFQACAEAADQVWRRGYRECRGDVECCQWLLAYAAYLRGEPPREVHAGSAFRDGQVRLDELSTYQPPE